MRSVVIAAILVAGPALADSEFRQGADFVRVTARPCEGAVAALIQAAGESPLDYRAASAQVAGKPYAACWKPVFPQRVIYIRYEDADEGLIPFDALKPVKEA